MKGSPLDLRAPVPILPGPADWKGTRRYEVRTRIGSGGMGAVYEAFASMIWAGVARSSGDREEEGVHLRAAVDRADTADMGLHAAVARMRLGAVVGADEGGDLARRAHAWMTEQGIARPDRIAAMLAPPAMATPPALPPQPAPPEKME